MGDAQEKTELFRDDTDRNDFLKRLAAHCESRRLIVYAWVLMSNHFHLLVRTGSEPLALGMKKILSGYVGTYNRRHKRWGHLFQNRYKSIVCEDDPYLLELTRYIHLNPLRAICDVMASNEHAGLLEGRESLYPKPRQYLRSIYMGWITESEKFTPPELIP